MDELILLAAHNGYLLVKYDAFNEAFVFEISTSDSQLGATATIPADRAHEITEFIEQRIEE